MAIDDKILPGALSVAGLTVRNGGVVSISADHLPGVDTNYDLGSATFRWRDLYLSRQAILNVASGTAPLVISSTTKVSNLNADLLDGADTTVAGGANAIPILDASGRLRLGADGSNALDAATKQQVDSAPVITEKAGNGTGDYSATPGVSFVDVDATNLAYTVTIPSGKKIRISFTCFAWSITNAQVQIVIGIHDGTSIIAERRAIVNESTGAAWNAMGSPWHIAIVVTGTGSPKTFKIQWRTTSASQNASMDNGSAAEAPRFIFEGA